MCIFCEIAAGRAPASIVYSDDDILAFMDIQPINPGHLLVVPQRHVAHLADLDEGTGGRIFQVGMKLAQAVRQADIRCEGVDLFLADGEAAGQEVFHVHLHVIPRFRGDGFGFRFPPGYRDLSEREALDKVATGVRRALEG
jgi:histidine triad (HIT) family protein